MSRVKEKTFSFKLLFRALLVNDEFVDLDNNIEYKPSEYIKKLAESTSNKNTIKLKEENGVVQKVNGVKAPNKGEKNKKIEEQVIDKDNELSL